MNDNTALLEQTLKIIKDSLDPDAFVECFSKVNKVHKEEDGYIYIIVPNVLAKYRIERWHLNKMNEILSELTANEKKFKLISLEDASNDKEKSKETVIITPDTSNNRRVRNMRSDYTFSNFEVGESNRFAFTSAMKVAESPHSLFNPLYIFGDVGLGKTHLMSAIGHYILDNNIKANVLFTTAQQFYEDYFIATNTKKGLENIEDFYNHYRSVDVLLVDDIQLLSDKIKSQEEFFKVFEDLFSKNKQIVITSDRSVNELENMMLRLKSRFGSGLVVPIKAPDESLCIKIIKRKLTFLLANPSAVDKDVILKLATVFKNNIRSLEGALSTYIMYCSYLGLPYNIETLNEALESIIPETNSKNNSSDNDSDNIKNVQKAICTYFNINITELTGSSRKKAIVYARQMAIYIIRKKYNISLKKIGNVFGGKDHTTIIHAQDKIESSLQGDEFVKKDYDLLISLIENPKLSTN